MDALKPTYTYMVSMKKFLLIMKINKGKPSKKNKKCEFFPH